jgi:hypothetical protein
MKGIILSRAIRKHLLFDFVDAAPHRVLAQHFAHPQTAVRRGYPLVEQALYLFLRSDDT